MSEWHTTRDPDIRYTSEQVDEIVAQAVLEALADKNPEQVDGPHKRFDLVPHIKGMERNFRVWYAQFLQYHDNGAQRNACFALGRLESLLEAYHEGGGEIPPDLEAFYQEAWEKLNKPLEG